MLFATNAESKKAFRINQYKFKSNKKAIDDKLGEDVFNRCAKFVNLKNPNKIKLDMKQTKNVINANREFVCRLLI